MIDKKEMLMKVASYDKATCVLANTVMAYSELKKKAAAIDDTISSIGWGSIPYVALPSHIGTMAGMLGSPATEEEEREWDRNRGYSYIPGVGSYRFQRRLKRLLTNKEGKTPHFWSQPLGIASSLLLASLVGGGVGAGIGGGIKRNRNGAIGGAMIGAATGMGVGVTAPIIGAIKAAIDKRRSKEEQKAYANSSTASEWLIPGVGVYNAFKTVGRSIGDSEDRATKEEKDKKAKETKTASVKSIVDGVLNKKAVDKKAVVINILNKAISK